MVYKEPNKGSNRGLLEIEGWRDGKVRKILKKNHLQAILKGYEKSFQQHTSLGITAFKNQGPT